MRSGLLSKNKKGWFIYAYALETKEIVTWNYGQRSAKTVKDLYSKLNNLEADTFCSTDWKAFAKNLPAAKYKIGKAYTKHIEEANLSLRTRNWRVVRKSVCFSKKQTTLWS